MNAQLVQRIRLPLIFGGVALLAYGLFVSGRPAPDTAPKSNKDAMHARWACQDAVKARMHDPSSAEWLGLDGWPVRVEAKNTSIVTATYRAKNGFGALRVSTATCRATFIEAQNEWHVPAVLEN